MNIPNKAIMKFQIEVERKSASVAKNYAMVINVENAQLKKKG